MYPGGYTAEVTSLSPKATEKEVYDFFVNCGPIEFVEIIRSGEYACTAYVTFKDHYALETALLLSGAKIADRVVSISRWGSFVDDSDPWSWKPENNSSTAVHTNQFVSSPSEAITVAQDVVKTMIAKGYDLGKDVLVKAKAFDESHQVSSSAASKVVELSNRIGLTEKINTGMEVVKTIDDRLHVSEITKSAAVVTGTAAVVAVTVTAEAAAAASSAVVNSGYFSKGALWVSDALSRAANAASNLATQGSK
ncbi:binding partner of ACD11 1 isoform X2 [Punica granatum]|nr:binding partner of ACD11 1 isoform X2 [Punica granatum]XP_031407150.1 binding partner of ACD11 1 isoform X2 [Punica granatum]OWM73965.1 hypothetical protein CDL15_Pgr022236 [Punica granatum]PKI46547.1 hypothetical protein CRG98_033104 [Punica granatum]